MEEFKTNDKFYPWGVNILGQVINMETKELITCKVGTHGYYYKSKHLVHRMVAELFIPNPDNKPQVNHKDSVRTNNHIDNLEWVTRSENLQHMVKQGRNSINGLIGEDNHLTKYPDSKIVEICEHIMTGKSNKEIAEITNVPSSRVKMLRAKKNRKYITKNYDFPVKTPLLSSSDVVWICEKLSLGLGNVEIANMSSNINITEDAVKRIKYRKCYLSISSNYEW